MIWIIIAGAIALTDLILKHYVDRYVTSDTHKPLFGGKIYLTKVHNKGVAFGALKDKPEKAELAASAGAGAAAACFIHALTSKGSAAEKLGESLIAGGAASNTADRIIEHQVTDYIRPNLFGHESRLTFNLGDFAILSGALLMMADLIRRMIRH